MRFTGQKGLPLGVTLHGSQGAGGPAGEALQAAVKALLGDDALLGPGVMITASNYETAAGRPVTGITSLPAARSRSIAA